MSKQNRFHACATCIHFKAFKQVTGMKYLCSRLHYETVPSYVFNCWDPKPHIIKLINANKDTLEDK